MLYYCKPPNIVVAVHNDESLYVLDPIQAYGLGTYMIVDLWGLAPLLDPDTQAYLYPTISPSTHSASVKIETRRRIILKVSESAQNNINTHITALQSKQLDGLTLTPTEQIDVDYANAIWAWIGRPAGMQGTADALIAAHDMEWYLDIKWPPWNAAWDAFVARF